MAEIDLMSAESKTEQEKPIDRNKTCPLLLRLFCNTGRHHNLSEYGRSSVPAEEFQIYTWKDATLHEISGLVKEVKPDARKKGTIFDFALVVPNVMKPGYKMRDIGTTISGQKGSDDSKTLSQLGFTIGDYMDIAITPPNFAQRGMWAMDRSDHNRDDRRNRRLRSFSTSLTRPY